MENSLRRISPRVGINRSLSYNGMDARSNIIERYMGVALNISQNGIQLETDRKIQAEQILLMYFDYNGNYVSAKGRIVYSNLADCGKFRTGIHLTGEKGSNLKFVTSLIKAYYYQKKVRIFVS